MKSRIPTTIFTSLVALAAAGCADTKGYPSLAPRAVEKVENTTIPAPPLAAASIGADSRRRINEAATRANEASSAFNAALANAQSAVAEARGAAFGTDSWINAQTAISALERTRAPIKLALSDLDDEQRRVIEQAPLTDLSPLETAKSRITAQDISQSQIIERLIAQLKSR